MSEELKLKPCPRCRKDVSVIHAHGCKFIRCDCGIQSSRYGEHIADRHMVADWNCRPVEDSQAARIAELEAERDRLLEAMCRIERKINSAKTACPPFIQREFEEAQKWAHEALEGAGNVEKDS